MTEKDSKSNNSVATKNLHSIKSNEGESILLVRPTKTREEAIRDKMNMLNVRLFGISLGSYKIESMRNVLVPYSYLTYEFSIQRHTALDKKGRLDRFGNISLIFDLNEFHPFAYENDHEDKLIFEKVEKDKAIGFLLDPSKTEEEMLKKAEWYIQNRLLRRIYATNAELRLVKLDYFYRKAVEIEVSSTRTKNVRYAYCDHYCTGNEHIFGLKYRLD